MNELEIFKALANKTRLQILDWLKDPEKNFPDHNKSCELNGVCVGYIQMKSGLTQSTISEYLTVLQKAGLITPTKVGQWTYYKRNEEVISSFTELMAKQL